jgi:hypothetical protein
MGACKLFEAEDMQSLLPVLHYVGYKNGGQDKMLIIGRARGFHFFYTLPSVLDRHTP